MVEFGPSNINGNGLIATRSIPAGTEIGISHQIDENLKGITVGGWKMNRPIGNYNHSYTPNCYLKDYNDCKTLVAEKDIAIGEELTADYTLALEFEQPMSWFKGTPSFRQFFNEQEDG
jgi:hypothetical protein